MASHNLVGNELAEVNLKEKSDGFEQFSSGSSFLEGVVAGGTADSSTDMIKGIFFAFVSGSSHSPTPVVPESIIAFFT
jgi:hypothetical protein